MYMKDVCASCTFICTYIECIHMCLAKYMRLYAGILTSRLNNARIHPAVASIFAIFTGKIIAGGGTCSQLG